MPKQPREPEEYFDDGTRWPWPPCTLWQFSARIDELARMRFRQRWSWRPVRRRKEIRHRKQVLFTLWRLQRGHCAYCLRQLHWPIGWDSFGGEWGSEEYWAWRWRRAHRITLDHVFPHAVGGPDERWNFVAACHGCNTAKCDRLIFPRLWPFADEGPGSLFHHVDPEWLEQALANTRGRAAS